jgi:hypothetical protein
MGPEMYGYRVTELRSLDSYRIVAGPTSRTLLLQDNPQETRLVHAVDDMDTVGVLIAVSRSSCVAHTSAVLTTLCWLQNFRLQRWEHRPPPQGLHFLAVPRCLFDVQDTRVRIDGDRFLQISFGLAIYVWGIVPDTNEGPPKHYHQPKHICNACSRVLRLCTLSLHSRVQTAIS